MRGLATLANAVSMNIAPPSASAMENTRLQAFKELRSLLSEVLSTAVADEQVPEAFKDSSNWEKLIAQTEHRLAEGWRLRFEGAATAQADRIEALSNLLNIIGRRNGASSLIKIGSL